MKYFLIIILLFNSFAFSQKKNDTDSITKLNEVLLYQKVNNRHINGIVPLSIIDIQSFKNSSPSELSAHLNNISGVYVLSGALNTNRITIRGVGSRTPYGTDKVRLYYNDIPVTNGSGFSTIEAYDLENLNAIEIIKGPKGTAFGANLGGAIVLRPNETLDKVTAFQNNFTVGSYGLIKNNLSFNHKTDKLSLDLRYGHLNVDGFRENNQYKRNGILLNTAYAINAKSKLSLLVNHIDYTAHIASSIDLDTFNDDPSQAAFTWKLAKGYEANTYTLTGFSMVHKFTQKLSNTTSVFYTHLDHYEPRPFNILDETTNGYGLRTQFKGNFYFNKRVTNYTFGAEVYKDDYNWSTFENLYEENNDAGSLQGTALSFNKEKRNQFNAFGTLTYSFTDGFSAQLGVAINKTSYNYKDLFNRDSENKSGKRSFDAIVLPNLQLNYNFVKNQLLYVNISKGYSNPSLEETLTPEGVINPNIAQETGINYELGSQLQFLNNKLKLNTTIYQMNIKNMLVAQRIDDDQYIGKNAGSTKHQGFELDINYNYLMSPKLKLMPTISYSYSNHKFVEFIDNDVNYSGNPLTGVPKHRINTNVQFQWLSGLSLNTAHTYVSSIPLTDANTISSASYNLLNITIGYRKQFSNSLSFETRIGVQNVTNTNYAQSVLINASSFGGRAPRYYYPGAPINYYGSLQLRYCL
ncbi:TonB-dependent receptor [Aureibaculum sp. A20]|uniref:TonB-dependent receptor n=1 Tax=Aureibaculum flavum TaxID=2795986 RepID=A0ABS0WLW4_9FLAO|nr:TonB-dependent receptor [Aureibaculum flavum]MBJ2172947.1 TonB-dependent receptor [Aureibaculum flavum]